MLFIGKQETFGRDFPCAEGTTIQCMDQSDYEGADIVWDLGHPVPDGLHGRFDFIYDGGCLDNKFNPGQAMMNFTRMLKPGGRIVCIESASAFSWAYVMFSPGWFEDYFASNAFDAWQVYVCSFMDHEGLVGGPWKLYAYDRSKNSVGPAPGRCFSLSCASLLPFPA